MAELVVLGECSRASFEVLYSSETRYLGGIGVSHWWRWDI